MHLPQQVQRNTRRGRSSRVLARSLAVDILKVFEGIAGLSRNLNSGTLSRGYSFVDSLLVSSPWMAFSGFRCLGSFELGG